MNRQKQVDCLASGLLLAWFLPATIALGWWTDFCDPDVLASAFQSKLSIMYDKGSLWASTGLQIARFPLPALCAVIPL